MKNITLSAQAEAIDKARKVAAARHSTLNALFRDWLDGLVRADDTAAGTDARLDSLWQQTDYLRVGRKLTRDEMNER